MSNLRRCSEKTVTTVGQIVTGGVTNGTILVKPRIECTDIPNHLSLLRRVTVEDSEGRG